MLNFLENEKFFPSMNTVLQTLISLIAHQINDTRKFALRQILIGNIPDMLSRENY